mmetsp:Transcript_41871/g.98131  ORF Transcript_41871/g.98131 Transcript_41871/m.98131 type:complete len:214 (+) Transcript_41871:427-1068(+)
MDHFQDGDDAILLAHGTTIRSLPSWRWRWWCLACLHFGDLGRLQVEKGQAVLLVEASEHINRLLHNLSSVLVIGVGFLPLCILIRTNAGSLCHLLLDGCNLFLSLRDIFLELGNLRLQACNGISVLINNSRCHHGSTSVLCSLLLALLLVRKILGLLLLQENNHLVNGLNDRIKVACRLVGDQLCELLQPGITALGRCCTQALCGIQLAHLHS